MNTSIHSQDKVQRQLHSTVTSGGANINVQALAGVADEEIIWGRRRHRMIYLVK